MEMLDHPGWLWGLSLIVLTMAIHATSVVMLAFVAVRIRVRLETRVLKMWSLIAIVICVVGVIGLLLAVLHGLECVIWAVAYLWLGAIHSPMDALFLSPVSMKKNPRPSPCGSLMDVRTLSAGRSLPTHRR